MKTRGLDYADQRYYVPGAGRFMTADPYQASAGAGEPRSWNRYAYVGGDPINRLDPRGLEETSPDSEREIEWCITEDGRLQPSVLCELNESSQNSRKVMYSARERLESMWDKGGVRATFQVAQASFKSNTVKCPELLSSLGVSQTQVLGAINGMHVNNAFGNDMNANYLAAG